MRKCLSLWKLIPIIGLSLLTGPIYADSKPAELTLFDLRDSIDKSLLGEVDSNSKYFSYSSFQIIKETYCSAFVVRHPYSGKLQTMTAAHCMNKPETYSDVARPMGALMGLQLPTSLNIPVGGAYNPYQYDLVTDAFANLIPEDKKIPEDYVLKIAEEMPERGDVIHFEGFRRVALLGVDLATVGSSSAAVKCIYMGNLISSMYYNFSPENREPLFTIIPFAYCPKNDALQGGMSGGPVLNSQGEVIGIISGGIESSSLGNMDYQVAFFSPITLKDYHYSKPENLIPVKTGKIQEYNMAALGVIYEREGGKGTLRKPELVANTYYETEYELIENKIHGRVSTKNAQNQYARFEYFDDGVICKSNYFNYPGKQAKDPNFRRQIWYRISDYAKRDRPNACLNLGL